MFGAATAEKKEDSEVCVINPERSYNELQKKYEALLKDHDRVGLAFQNQKEQNLELARELQERESEAEELANLVRTKDEVVKNEVVNAKKVIADLRATIKLIDYNVQ